MVLTLLKSSQIIMQSLLEALSHRVFMPPLLGHHPIVYNNHQKVDEKRQQN
jgi:hypothetical protein